MLLNEKLQLLCQCLRDNELGLVILGLVSLSVGLWISNDIVLFLRLKLLLGHSIMMILILELINNVEGVFEGVPEDVFIDFELVKVLTISL